MRSNKNFYLNGIVGQYRPISFTIFAIRIPALKLCDGRYSAGYVLRKYPWECTGLESAHKTLANTNETFLLVLWPFFCFNNVSRRV